MAAHLRRPLIIGGVLIRRVAAGLLVLGLMMCTATMAEAKDTSGNTVAHLTDATPCQDVIFLGLRGSGEKANEGTWGMGKRVTAVYDSFVSTMKNSRIAATGVDYVAADVPKLVSLTPLGATAWEGYFASIDGGVYGAETTLISRSYRCPYEHYVLAGYSQGAMAIHRAVFDLSRAPLGSALDRILPKIDAVATLGDGDRVAFDDVVTLGSSPTEGQDYGVGLAGFPAGASFVPTNARLSSVGHGLNTRWFQVCDYGDLVCDYGRATTAGPFFTDLIAGLKYGYDAHTKNYTKNNFVVAEAGRQLALTTMAAPTTNSYGMAIRIVADPVPAQFSAVGYNAAYHVLVKNTGSEKFWAGMTTSECSINMQTWGTTGLPPADQSYVSPDEEWAWDCWHRLTPTDVSQGYFTATGAVFGSSDYTNVANTVVLPTQTASRQISVPVQMLTLSATGTPTTRYVTDWTITLLNSGNETVNTTPVNSSLCGSVPLPSDTLLPGQSTTVSCQSKVTEDYLAGSMNLIGNSVSETAFGLDAQPYSANIFAQVTAP